MLGYASLRIIYQELVLQGYNEDEEEYDKRTDEGRGGSEGSETEMR